MNFEWSSDVAQASWWTSRLSADRSKVSGFVPEGFADYCIVRSPEGIEGSLTRDELAALAEILAARTDTARLWAAVWDGFGQFNEGARGGISFGGEGRDATGGTLPAIAPAEVQAGPKVEVPGRSLLLLEGPLADVVPLYDFLGQQSPSACWPEDESWIVITEIDFAWTYVGGSVDVVTAIVDSPDLDVATIDPSDPVG